MCVVHMHESETSTEEHASARDSEELIFFSPCRDQESNFCHQIYIQSITVSNRLRQAPPSPPWHPPPLRAARPLRTLIPPSRL